MTPTRTSNRPSRALASVFLLVAFGLACTARADQEISDPYGYLRVLDGDVELVDGRYAEAGEASVNQPILVGDRFRLARTARAELVLPNGDLLRLGGSTDLTFLALSDSPDRPTGETHLRLLRGEIQLVIFEDPRESAPRIEAHNASVYFHRAGTYAVRVGGEDWTEVVVRQGYAEVETERGSLVVRDGEQAVLEGERWPRSSVEVAGSLSPVERWGEQLSEGAERWADSDLGEDLGYAASSLSDHGSWVEIGSRRAWRPRVSVGWQPYHDGYWYTTPSGLTWVSYEPWGWVPYHYGTWDYVSSWGWVWYPGRSYAPAWVYWYWTPSYAGWCPRGWYDRHYGFGGHSSYGVYGWAAGDWHHYRHWSFTRNEHLGRRDQARYTRPSQDFARESGLSRPGRGLITTDTRGVDREVLRKPDEPVRVLAHRPGRRAQGDSDLPDVTPFVAREPLPPDVERVITRPEKPAEISAPRLARKPLPQEPEAERKPTTEGRLRQPRTPTTVEEKPARGAKPAEVEQPQLYRRPAPAKPTEETESPAPRLERRPRALPPSERPKEQQPVTTYRAPRAEPKEQQPVTTYRAPRAEPKEQQPVTTYRAPRVERRPQPSTPPPSESKPSTVRSTREKPAEGPNQPRSEVRRQPRPTGGGSSGGSSKPEGTPRSGRSRPPQQEKEKPEPPKG